MMMQALSIAESSTPGAGVINRGMLGAAIEKACSFDPSSIVLKFLDTGEELLLVDTGATHELRSVRARHLVPKRAKRVELQVATGQKAAWMHSDIVYVVSPDDLQKLFPIVSYVADCDLKWECSREGSSLVMPNGEVIPLVAKGKSLYIKERHAEMLRVLRAGIKQTVELEALMWATANVVTTKMLEQHKLEGHLTFMKECEECRLASGRMRVHRRIAPSLKPGGELSVDMSGPHHLGLFPSALPEDAVRRARYYLLGAYQMYTAEELELRIQHQNDAAAAAGMGEVRPEERMIIVSKNLVATETDAGEVDTRKVLYYVEILTSKRPAEVLAALQRIVANVEEEFHGRVIYRLHGDRASELTGKQSKDYFAAREAGPIVVTATPGKESNNNGRAERGIGVTTGMGRTMLMALDPADRKLLWPMSIQHGAYNQRAKVLDKKISPVPFGATVTARLKEVPQDKFAPRAKEVNFLGVCEFTSHGFLTGFKTDGEWKIEVTSSFVHNGIAIESEPVAVPIPVSVPAGSGASSSWEHAPAVPEGPAPATPSDVPIPRSPAQHEDQLPSDDEDPFASPTAHEEHWTCPGCKGQKKKHARDHTCKLGPPQQYGCAAAIREYLMEPAAMPMESLDWDDAPPEYHDILKESGMHLMTTREVKATFGVEYEQWKMACKGELDGYDDQGTFEELTEEEKALVREKDILPMKTVQGVKSTAPFNDKISRKKKVRGVVCGNFPKRTGPEMVYTENVEVATIRAALAEAAHQRWSIGALDVKLAFLNAELPPELGDVIVRPPALFVAMGLVKPGTLWRCKKAIYGLRVSPKAWADRRDKELRAVRFEGNNGMKFKLQRSHVDRSVWTVVEDTPTISSRTKVYGYILTYVDDFIYFAVPEICEQIKTFVKKLWQISLQPLLQWGTNGEIAYLGLTIRGRPDGYEVHQHKYLNELIEKWGLSNAGAVGTIDIEKVAEDEDCYDEPLLSDVRTAQKMSGGLIWLSGRSRPDISYSVSRISSQATKRPIWALRLGKRVIRYLLGTKKHVLLFVANIKEQQAGFGLLKVYGDASFEPTMAQSGIVVYYIGMLIDWRSIKQAQVPRSTGEAELTVLATANLIVEGTESLLNSMEIEVISTLIGDNEASISMAHNVNSWRTRALCNRSAGLRSRVEDGTLDVTYISTKEQKADGLTKFLACPQMSTSRQVLLVVAV